VSKNNLTIENVTLYHVELPLRSPFTTSFGTVEARGTLLVRLQSGDLCGWGSAAHLPAPVYVPEFLQAGKLLLAEHILPRTVGLPLAAPADIAKCYSGLRGNNLSKAALEMAAWDLFAKANAKPLYEQLGSTRNVAEVGISIGVKQADALLAEIAKSLEDGYKRIKIKIRPGADVSVIQQVRGTFPDVPLMVDANSAYGLSDVDTFRKMDQFGLMMIEQPLAADDIVDHAKLQKQIATPICLDESIFSAQDARKAGEMGSCKVINIKPGRVGGLAESLRILTVCRTYGLDAWVGGMLESGLGRAFLNHLAVQDGVTLPGDLSPSNAYLAEDIADSPPVRKGLIMLGDEPGVGVKVKEDILDKCLKDKLEFAA